MKHLDWKTSIKNTQLAIVFGIIWLWAMHHQDHTLSWKQREKKPIASLISLSAALWLLLNYLWFILAFPEYRAITWLVQCLLGLHLPVESISTALFVKDAKKQKKRPMWCNCRVDEIYAFKFSFKMYLKIRP